MINKVTLIGNLGGDPEIRHLENGAMVGRFSLATNENYKDKEGNWQTQTEWHNVVVWRELAERAEKNLKKGMMVYVEGKVSYRKYQDKDGVEKYTTDIVANSFRMLERRESSGYVESRFPQEEKGVSRTTSVSAEPTVTANSTPPASNENATSNMPSQGDDLPF